MIGARERRRGHGRHARTHVGTVERRGEDFTRQREIDRSGRRGLRDAVRAVDDLLDVHAVAQFVIPLHDFAHHAGLIEHLLRPVNVAVPRAEAALFVERRAARHKDDRHLVARRVHDRAHRVHRTDADVTHHRLRLARHQVEAVGHTHGEVLVRRDERGREIESRLLESRVRFDDRREVGAGIDEKILRAVALELREERFGRRLHGQVLFLTGALRRDHRSHP